MMTAEEYLARSRELRWYGEQGENGVNMPLIRASEAPGGGIYTKELGRMAGLVV